MNPLSIAVIPLMLALIQPVFSKKILVFDEKQGIRWVEEGTQGAAGKGFQAPTIRKGPAAAEETTITVRRPVVKIKTASSADYAKAGLQFYYSRDYEEALKYFRKAWEGRRVPTYYFLIGATLSKMGRYEEMGKIFNEMRMKYPKDSAADDAVFYLAVYYQSHNEYQMAHELYRDVVELYPQGTSVIGSINFRDEAKQQLRAMKIDILSRLKLLGYRDNNALELLKEFQKKNRLSETGKPDRRTVELLIRKSDAREQKLKRRIEDDEAGFTSRTLFALLLDCLLAGNLLWGLRNLRAVNNQFRRLTFLEQVTE